MRHASTRTQQTGVSLLEALFSLLVLSVGVAATGHLHRHLETHADIARQRSEAVRLAQEDLEAARLFGSPAATDARSVQDSAALRLNTTFELTRQIDTNEATAAPFRSATVAVVWRARDGSTQQTVLASALTDQDPAFSGALTLIASAQAGAAGRSSAIPPGVHIVDDRRSAFKPSPGATVAFVVDNASARVVEQCIDVPAEVRSEDLKAEHLTHCTDFKALLLSGVVRFSGANPPDALAANDTPLALALSVGLPGMVAPASPWCHAEARKTVVYRAADGVHREAVALEATPASLGATDWQDTGERYTAYRCVVAAAGDPPRWSGQSIVVPLGWEIGSAPAQRKVCRYVNDSDGSGAIDRNDEHPSVYREVDRALLQQNFLVMRGDLACPQAAAATIDPLASGSTASVATVQHQP